MGSRSTVPAHWWAAARRAGARYHWLSRTTPQRALCGAEGDFCHDWSGTYLTAPPENFRCPTCQRLRGAETRRFARRRLAESEAAYAALPASASGFRRTALWAEVDYWRGIVTKEEPQP